MLVIVNQTPGELIADAVNQPFGSQVAAVHVHADLPAQIGPVLLLEGNIPIALPAGRLGGGWAGSVGGAGGRGARGGRGWS